MKHTPGPWMVNDQPSIYPYVTAPSREGGPHRITLANCPHPADAFHVHERDANAHLIAAAPEMLEACKEALRLIRNQTGNWQLGTEDMLERAIAKAEGRNT